MRIIHSIRRYFLEHTFCRVIAVVILATFSMSLFEDRQNTSFEQRKEIESVCKVIMIPSGTDKESRNHSTVNLSEQKRKHNCLIIVALGNHLY